MTGTTKSKRGRSRSFRFDADVLRWLEQAAADQRTTVTALANQILAAAMEASQQKSEAAA